MFLIFDGIPRATPFSAVPQLPQTALLGFRGVYARFDTPEGVLRCTRRNDRDLNFPCGICLGEVHPFIKLLMIYIETGERFKYRQNHNLPEIFINKAFLKAEKQMPPSQKLIESIIKQIAGEETVPLYNALKNKKNVSEFILAEKLKEEINVVRNKLYRLYHANLVSFTRKKDKQKGWYIYYWTFNAKRVKFLLVDLKRDRADRLQEMLKKERSGFFYMCTNRCMRLNFDKAVDFNYKCPECGGLMEQMDNAKKIQEMEKELAALKKELVKRAPKLRTQLTEEEPEKKVTKKKVKPKAKKKTTKAKTVKKKAAATKKKTVKKKTKKK